MTAEAIPLDLRQLIETSLDSIAVVANGKELDLVYATSIEEDAPLLLADPHRVSSLFQLSLALDPHS